MKQRKIMLKTIEDAKKFVNASMKCDFDIDVFYNRVVIDAKSILGVMSLDLTQILTVEYMGEDAEYEAFLDTMEANNVTAERVGRLVQAEHRYHRYFGRICMTRIGMMKEKLIVRK